MNALNSNVLVLNKLYMAIHIVNVKRAFALLYKDFAEVIHICEDEFQSYDFESWVEVSQMETKFKEHFESVKTISFEIKVPKIIRLLFYDKLPKKKVKFNRKNIYARDKNRCQYCGKKYPTSELSLDHVVPKSRGGHSTWENIVCACTECNNKKGGKTLQECRLKLIRKPKKPKQNPLLNVKISTKKYRSWKQFIDNAYWSVELKED